MADLPISGLTPDNDFAQDDLIEISKDIGGGMHVTRSVKKSDFMPIVTHAAVLFNWTASAVPQVITASSNVASVVGLDTRVFRITFTNPLPNLNYYPSASCQIFTGGGGSGAPFVLLGGPKTLNYVDVHVSNDVNVALSRDDMFIEVRGFE